MIASGNKIGALKGEHTRSLLHSNMSSAIHWRLIALLDQALKATLCVFEASHAAVSLVC